MSLLEDSERAEIASLIAAGEAHEAWILDYAQSVLVKAENTVAEALEGGFRAKVPMVGGAISAAIATATSTLEGEQATELKAGFDATMQHLRGLVAT